jgi:osmotically-inducible protein OsmY
MTNNGLTLIGGIGLGAALMYMLDPDRGRRRRALVRDQLAHVASRVPDAIDAAARDLSNRARGLVAESSAIFTSDEASDEVIVERVRSKMGRVVSHPHAIEVAANEGRITLRGPILADEVDELLSCVSSVKGVKDVENQLEVHSEADNVPSLQGGRPRPGDRFELMQENWSPTARLLVGGAGGALAAYGLSRRDSLGIGLGVIGLGLLARGATNIEMTRLVSTGTSLFGSDSKSRAGEEIQMETTAETDNGPGDDAQRTLAQGA